ncbi:hypothetical protein GFB57_09705 [Citrobacter sp. S39]|nr:hypothetical protein AM349_11555 [Citrobacter freundii]PSF21621.1 hypothetical protein C6985_16035 [Escherichia coli]QFX91415.1 hypothetical protein GFB57_09705 [Citrobacter sp. S39]AUU29134.1 hypothetical protein MC62_016010 [Citrobacter freundii]AYL45255.1 hypothetical protein CUC45_15200 [Citrobacter freundii]
MTRSTFGSSFNALRSSLDISSSLFALPDGAALIRSADSADPINQFHIIPRNPGQDRAPGE